MKTFLNICIFFLFAAAAAAAAVVFDLQLYAAHPASREPDEKTVTISAGQSFAAVTRELMEKGLVKAPLKFKVLARFTGSDKRIKAGEYRLLANMTPRQMLDTLVHGDEVLYRLTIPEGFDLVQIADAVAAGGWAGPDAFLSAARNPAFIQELGMDVKSLEGYLFPETYFFPAHAGAETIIATMVRRFKANFKPEWEDRAKDMGFTVHEIVTLASIIEKETGTASERPLISSVFHNRLQKGMRLDSDPSVIYGIADYSGNITRKHLNTKTPYNTYQIRGLPPGPIASPGLKSIEAALYPADTNFLFFVSKKDSTHHFSTNIRDHNRAVRKYQLNK